MEFLRASQLGPLIHIHFGFHVFGCLVAFFAGRSKSIRLFSPIPKPLRFSLSLELGVTVEFSLEKSSTIPSHVSEQSLGTAFVLASITETKTSEVGAGIPKVLGEYTPDLVN